MGNEIKPSGWQDSFVEANGIRVHYHRTGGHLPPLVMAHGYTDNGLCWLPVAKELESRFDIVMPDARGHGLSDAPATGYSDVDLAADLAGFIDALELDRPVVLGHSMGAMTAATTAARYPRSVAAVMLEDPPWWMGEGRPGVDGDPADMVEAQRAFLIQRAAMSSEELVAEARAESPAWSEEELAPWVLAKQQVRPEAAGLFFGDWTPWREVVSAIACPILLITADNERGALVTPQVAAEAQSLSPALELVHIAGAGHSIRREAFEAYLEAVEGFLGRLRDDDT